MLVSIGLVALLERQKNLQQFLLNFVHHLPDYTGHILEHHMSLPQWKTQVSVTYTMVAIGLILLHHLLVFLFSSYLMIVTRVITETGISTFETEGRNDASVWVWATESTRNVRGKKYSSNWICLRDHCNELRNLESTNILSQKFPPGRIFFLGSHVAPLSWSATVG
jgi:hypothetical protein